jgi:hypothetical protein
MNVDLCINLNVGGAHFSTSLASLRKFPNSMLGAMFSGNHHTPQTSQGTYFIDRDGTHFRHILNFLRDPEAGVVELSPREEEELKREAKFYCLFDEMFPPEPTDNDLVSISENDEDGDSALFTRDLRGVWYQSNQSYAEAPYSAIVVNVCSICYTGFYRDPINLCSRYIKGFASKVGKMNPNQPNIDHKECTICNGEKLVDLNAIQNGGIVAYNKHGGFKYFSGHLDLCFARVGSATDGISWLVEFDLEPVQVLRDDVSPLEEPFAVALTNDFASYITKDDIIATGMIFDEGLLFCFDLL